MQFSKYIFYEFLKTETQEELVALNKSGEREARKCEGKKTENNLL